MERARQRETVKPKSAADAIPSHMDPGFDDENNVGSKLLQKMGWKKGEGIGKQNIIQQPLEVVRKEKKKGERRKRVMDGTKLNLFFFFSLFRSNRSRCALTEVALGSMMPKEQNNEKQ